MISINTFSSLSEWIFYIFSFRFPCTAILFLSGFPFGLTHVAIPYLSGTSWNCRVIMMVLLLLIHYVIHYVWFSFVCVCLVGMVPTPVVLRESFSLSVTRCHFRLYSGPLCEVSGFDPGPPACSACFPTHRALQPWETHFKWYGTVSEHWSVFHT